MKTIAIGSIFVLIAIVALIATVPTAFADHAKASVSIPTGTSVPGCEKTADGCYIPMKVTVDVGGEVTWTNNDSAAHTVTSGTAKDGPDGKFDSSLFMAGKTFSVKFTDYEPGTVPYFCMVHPWMVGEVIVQAAGMEEEHEEEEHEETMTGAMVSGMSKDGSVMVKIDATKPTANEMMKIDVSLTKKDGTATQHANYDIVATQDGKQVLSDKGAHQHEGKGSHTTMALASDKPVDIQVTLNGFGLPGEEAKWTGPKGEVVTLQVVPEFGTIAMMILVVSIVSIIAITAKTRVIPKL
ncbi:MAG TPA: PEFG-CTERM sorting domain-containing protein [Nitrosopumilaceae archaeon]|nr:PEFG-CTERM sorting domain-containing protein [Nitrosopumilaceae archaeon]